MKIIYLISHARISGPVNQALNILNGLKLNGRIKGTLVTLAPEIVGNSWLNRFEKDNIEIYSLEQSFWKTLFCIPKLRRYLKENNVDLIHSSGFRANFISILMPSKYAKVSTQRSSPADIAEKLPHYLRPFIIWAYLKMIKRIPNNVACSKSLSNVFINKFGINIPYVQNGVNSDLFKPLSAGDKIELRKKLNLDVDKRIYLTLGSLNKRKNNKMLIRVANSLANLPIIFLIVGSGPEDNCLRALAQAPHIVFTGTTKNPLQYLQVADVLISCSLAEGLPNTVLEALSCGLPCILSDIEPHRELIANSSLGGVFNLNNDESLRNIIIDSLTWDSTMSDKAREVAIKQFDRKVIANNYESVYKVALNNISK